MATTRPEINATHQPEPEHRPVASVGVLYARAFAGLFLRDLHVLRREMLPFLVRVIMNPLLFLFVFTYIMPHMSGGTAMNPTASMASAVRGKLLHRSAAWADGGGHHVFGDRGGGAPAGAGVRRDARDRRPRDVSFAGGGGGHRKDFFSAVQSMIAAGVVFPLAYYMPATPVYAHVNSWAFLIAVLSLASLTSGALGLVIGTSVRPQQIGLIFGVVVMPITFLGCVYYPWAALKAIPWLQYGVLINPIVYMSEGLRAALTPGLHHMNPWLILAMLTCSFAVLTCFGIRGFLRRVID